MRFSITKLAFSAVVVAIILAVNASDASAFNPRYRRLHGGAYHAARVHTSHVRHFRPYVYTPSFHWDTYYHHEYNHFTPRRGWHSHGHFDVVPHFGGHHYGH